MHRIAIFVEGYTELLFVQKLIEEVAGSSRVVFEHRRVLGGTTVPRRVVLLQASRTIDRQKYFILIIDCGGDKQVKTRLCEEHSNLTAKGYWRLIGIRDVSPDFSRHEIPSLERGLRFGVKTRLAPVQFILSVMEIEAWFVSEHTHFVRIDPALTRTAIATTLGFDPATDDISQRPTPGADLDNCYRLAGKSYIKGSPVTVNALDYAEMYLELPARIPYLASLTQALDEFLNLAPEP